MDKGIQGRGPQGWLLLSGFLQGFHFYLHICYLPTYLPTLVNTL